MRRVIVCGKYLCCRAAAAAQPLVCVFVHFVCFKIIFTVYSLLLLFQLSKWIELSIVPYGQKWMRPMPNPIESLAISLSRRVSISLCACVCVCGSPDTFNTDCHINYNTEKLHELCRLVIWLNTILHTRHETTFTGQRNIHHEKLLSSSHHHIIVVSAYTSV